MVVEIGLGGVLWWWLSSALVDDSAKEFVGVSPEVGAGGDHCDGGLGEFGVEAGEFGAEVDGVGIRPNRPEDPFDFGGLAGVVADCGDQGWDGGFEFVPGLGGELAAEGYGGEEFGDGVGLGWGWHGVVRWVFWMLRILFGPHFGDLRR
jgi:hypothetical protein